MDTHLPPVIDLGDIESWLPEVFPEGTQNRPYVIRQMAAKTVFTTLYVGAIEGADRWLRPDQVTKMSDAQARTTDEADRIEWAKVSVTPGAMKTVPDRWYAQNTRESIRDESLRQGLIELGAVIERTGVPTTSSKPRYALAADFARLLVTLNDRPPDRQSVIHEWQEKHLSRNALSRVTILRQGLAKSGQSDRVTVCFPNGETRLMNPGPSTVITKAVIEMFAVRYLRQPAVVFVSESREKVVARDEALAQALHLDINAARNLPDVVLADVATNAPRLVFVEVVATDGPINQQRKRALAGVAQNAGFPVESVFYVTAFADRTSTAFRKLAGEVAWGTFVWFTSEPGCILKYSDGDVSASLDALTY